MELWNRSLVAVVTVLGFLLCGVVVLSALLARFPHKEHALETIAQGPGMPAPQNLPADTRKAIALRTLELVSARARIAQLEANEREYRSQIRSLLGQLQEIRDQFRQSDLERDASLEWLNLLLASGDFLGPHNNNSEHDPSSEEVVTLAVSEGSFELDSLEQQIELDELRAQVASLQSFVEELQTAADLESAELLLRKRELGQATAELFARLGEAGVPILVEALESPDPLVRQWAADSLRLLGPVGQPAIPYLSLALEDGDPRVRDAARLALTAIRD